MRGIIASCFLIKETVKHDNTLDAILARISFGLSFPVTSFCTCMQFESCSHFRSFPVSPSPSWVKLQLVQACRTENTEQRGCFQTAEVTARKFVKKIEESVGDFYGYG